ncbi:hypothetical protein [Grimontia marina]|uniref:Type 4 fimbrial biogenesis protein PilX N-terminal domain-containing protein n=1 Tax=Grimontia marina TaxID=646534 RepID=A0A128FI77_9GAMM|nr:hypothetical protein [Grimontia marina]CZF85971.1 hypothetical protein GMA8713_04004 [Grimontia marina]
MNTQKGMATLAVVSGVLLVVALFAISVANSGLADIKKAQNQILDAKQRASAKAGLDCAIAVFEQNELNPNDADFSDSEFDECEGSSGGLITVIGSESPWLLSSFVGYASSKIVIQAGGATAAAFKTSGSLVVEGGNDWTPAKGNKIGTVGGVDTYECIAIIAGGDVTIDVGTAKFTSDLPGEKEKCGDLFSTYIPENSNPITNDFELDILHGQENIKVFEEFFDTPRVEWESVKKTFDKVLVTGSAQTDKDKVSECGADIKTLLESNSVNSVWVEGDCYLQGLSGGGDANKPALIVVKNGVVGAKTAFTFNGTILQFSIGHSESNVALSWGAYKKTDGTNHIMCNDGAMKSLCDELKHLYEDDASKWGKLPFYFHGSFESAGQYLLDVPDSVSRVRGSFKPKYNGDSENPSSGGAPKLVKGSIHDF